MKKIILFLFITANTGIMCLISCKKDLVSLGEVNKTPVANAGPDQSIVLPMDSVVLDGTASTDPDGTISSFLWTKISGPVSFSIVNTSAAKTSVKNLAVGIYKFELKITDDGGLSAKDTMMAIVDVILTTNHPPVANAGPDQIFNYPINATGIDGSGSMDPENNITDYQWTKIAGPLSFNITTANAAQTLVSNLVEGIYQLELKVTDAAGLYSRDTMSISLNFTPGSNCDIKDWPVIHLKLTEIGRLSEPRIPVIGAAGTKIVFAGGSKDLVCGWEWELSSSVVDIYDITSNRWSTTRLSKERSDISVVSNGNKIFFAGGVNWEDQGSGQWNKSYDNIDIYDVSTNAWTVAYLSKAREGISAVSIGNKVIFAGGIFFTGNPFSDYVRDATDVIDIYDMSTNKWSTSILSVARANSFHLVKGDSVYFMGGTGNTVVSNAVDIYNNSTNTWTSFVWSEEKINKFLTDAGVLNGSATNPCFCGTGVSGNSMMVVRYGFYNTATDKCTVGILPPFPPGMDGASSIALNNKHYYAGGYSQDNKGCFVLHDKVYVLEW